MLCMSAAMGLSACHHHSHHHSSSDPAEPEENSVSMSFSGQVIDGYLANAKVCADLNQNYVCDGDEPSASTDEKGKFVIDAKVIGSFLAQTAYKCLLTSDCKDKLPVRILALSGEDTKNITLGKDAPLANPVALSSVAFLSTETDEEAGSKTVAEAQITPYTTLTDLAMDNASDVTTVTEEALNETFDKVAEDLGVDPKVARSDYNDPANVTDDTKKALVAGEVTVRSGLIPESLEEIKERQEAELTVDDVAEATASVKEDVKTIIEATKGSTTGDIADALNTYSDEVVTSLKQLAGHDSDEFKCGISKKNNVWCWGADQSGNLGNIDVFPKDKDGNPIENGYAAVDNFSAKPVMVKTADGKPLSNVKSIDSGNGHVCAVTFDGQLYCWGSNWYGQTGTSKDIAEENSRVFAATKVLKGQQNAKGDYLSNVESVRLSHNATCAVIKNGEVYCWGENTVKQLGAAHPDLEIKTHEGQKSLEGIDLSDLITAIPTPVKVEFPDTVAKVKELTAGLWTYCALVENKDPEEKHNVYCWGDDTRGLVSQNWMQYQKDFLDKYASRLKFEDQSELADPEGNQNWNWHIYDEGLEWHPLYGAPVTQVRNVTTAEADENRDENYIGLENLQLENIPDDPWDLDAWTELSPEVKKYVQDHDVCLSDGKDYCKIGWQNFGVIYRIDDNEADYMEYEGPGSKEEIENFLKNDVPGEILQLQHNIGIVQVTYPTHELSNVTKFAIAGFDSQLLHEVDGDSILWATYNQGPLGATSWWSIFSSMSLNGEKIAKIDANVEGRLSFVLSDKGNLYGLPSSEGNKYGTYGIGDADYEQNWSLDESIGRWVVSNPVRPLLNSAPLANVVDVSVGKRSVCATVKKTDSKGETGTENQLYCWGSSTFGQLGFDNGDGGFSYTDTAKEWTGYSAVNKYFDKETRIEDKPRQVKFPTDAK